MARLLTTMLLCAVSMIGAALIAAQGFGPDPIADVEKASIYAECQALDDEHARGDCLDLKLRDTSRR